VSPRRQTAVGLTLAGMILVGWLALHVWGVFLHPWTPTGIAAAPLLIAVQSWLGAGMFIVAHDAMHGSLAPGRPRLNHAVGQAAVGLYAAFPYRKLHDKHHAHHRAPGSTADPDFHPQAPTAFLPWYLRFFRTYFGWREFGLVTVVLVVYLFVLRVSPLNAALFWGLPAILSSLQLFVFGTWLPHRHERRPFADAHNARSLEFPWLLSLLTCFHFGYHREHHLSPGTPWWRLPSVRAQRRAVAVDAATPAL
jgi:beta-carotene/zeaxanthin 4-ketolase